MHGHPEVSGGFVHGEALGRSNRKPAKLLEWASLAVHAVQCPDVFGGFLGRLWFSRASHLAFPTVLQSVLARVAYDSTLGVACASVRALLPLWSCRIACGPRPGLGK